MKCHSNHIISRVHMTNNLLLLLLILITWVCDSFLQSKVSISHFLHAAIFQRKLLWVAQNEGVGRHSKVSTWFIWNSSEWEICHFFPIYLFSYFYISTDSWYLYFGYDPKYKMCWPLGVLLAGYMSLWDTSCVCVCVCVCVYVLGHFFSATTRCYRSILYIF